MSDLPPVLAREVDRWVRELTAGDGGLLFIAVGRAQRRRVAVERRLAGQLSDWDVGVASLSAGGDPWQSVVSRGGHALVSLHDIPRDEEEWRDVLAALNVGREHLRAGSPSVVLWVDGVDDLDGLLRQAPDLWSYRRHIGYFWAREDFESPPPVVHESLRLDERIARLREEIAELEPLTPFLSIMERPSLATALAEYGQALYDMGDHDAAREAHARMKAELNHEIHQATAARQGRGAAVYSSLLEPFAQIHRDDERASLVRRRGLRDFLDHGEGRRSGRDALDVAGVWLDLGNLDAATQHGNEAGSSQLDQGRFDSLRARIARARLDMRFALHAEHLGHARLLAMSAWGPARESGMRLVADYGALGLLDECELFLNKLASLPCPRRELAVGLELTRARVQACCDPEAARATCDAALAELDAQLRVTSMPAAHERLLHARVDVLALLVELDATPARRSELLATLEQAGELDSDLGQRARLRHVEQLAGTGQYRTAHAVATKALAWSTRHEGPSRVAEVELAIAAIHRSSGDFDGAEVELRAAESQLRREPAPLQPVDTWRAVWVERHHLALARDDHDEALAWLERALEHVSAAGLRRERLELLHMIAEQLPTPTSAARRLAAARESLELARDAWLAFEEARSLANLALLELEAGATALARRNLDEALVLARHCALEPYRTRIALAKRRVDP